MADQMHDGGLHHGVWKDGVERMRDEPFERDAVLRARSLAPASHAGSPTTTSAVPTRALAISPQKLMWPQSPQRAPGGATPTSSGRTLAPSALLRQSQPRTLAS